MALFAPLATLTPPQRRAFVASFLGWTVLICMDIYSKHFFLLLRRRFHREVLLAASAFGSTG
jgi:hypothetical protein